MPFVEITMGEGALTSEQKITLNKAVTECIKGFYMDVKGYSPSVYVIIREHAPDNFLINGETLTEVRKKRELKK